MTDGKSSSNRTRNRKIFLKKKTTVISSKHVSLINYPNLEIIYQRIPYIDADNSDVHFSLYIIEMKKKTFTSKYVTVLKLNLYNKKKIGKENICAKSRTCENAYICVTLSQMANCSHNSHALR